VICVIDSKNLDSYKDNSTAKYQIGGSNIMILNKTDLIDNNELEVIKKEVTDIKEEYNIKNTLTGKTIFSNYVINNAQQGLVNKDIFEGVYKIDEIIGLAKDYKHPDHTAKDSITQKVAYLKEGIEFNDVDEVLKNIPKSIYRVKGVVKVKDVPNPIVINYSFGNVSFEELDEYAEPSIMIFIGETIEDDVNLLCNKFDFLNIPKFRLSK
jgi:G3E family GTPase